MIRFIIDLSKQDLSQPISEILGKYAGRVVRLSVTTVGRGSHHSPMGHQARFEAVRKCLETNPCSMMDLVASLKLDRGGIYSLIGEMTDVQRVKQKGPSGTPRYVYSIKSGGDQ